MRANVAIVPSEFLLLLVVHAECCSSGKSASFSKFVHSVFFLIVLIGYAGNMQQMGPGSAPGSGPAPIRPTLLTTPAGQQNLQNLTSSGRAAAEPPKDAFGEFNFLNKKKQPDTAMPAPNGTAMPAPNATPRGLDNSLNNVCINWLSCTCQPLRWSAFVC